MRTYEATPPASATLCCPSVCSVRTYTQILPCSPFRGSEHQMDSGGVTHASSVVSMMFWGFSWTVKSCRWNLWNSLNWTKRTTVTLLLQENDQLCIKSFFQPLLTPTGSAFYFYRCCSSFVHMLLMWSAIESVDFHPSTSRTQNGRSLFSAVLHVSESRSPGFFLRSRVNRCGGQCVLKLLANSSSSAGWMKLELMSSRFTELGEDPENSSASTHTFLAVGTDGRISLQPFMS